MHILSYNRNLTTSVRSVAFNIEEPLDPEVMDFCVFDRHLDVTLVDGILRVVITDNNFEMSYLTIETLNSAFAKAQIAYVAAVKKKAYDHVVLMNLLKETTGVSSD